MAKKPKITKALIKKAQEEFVTQAYAFIEPRLDAESISDLAIIKKAVGFKHNKNIIDLLVGDVSPNLVEPLKNDLGVTGVLNSIDLIPIIQPRINKVEKKLSVEQQIIFHRVFTKIIKHFLVFQLSVIKNDVDRFDITDAFEGKVDSTIIEAGYLNNFSAEDIERAKQLIFSGFSDVKDIYLGEQNKVEIIDSKVTKALPQVVTKKHFLWREEEALLEQLHKVLSEHSNPFFEKDMSAFKSLFNINGVTSGNGLVKILRNNSREIAYLFHSLCEKNFIESNQKRSIKQIISVRLLDFHGKSISLDNLKKSYTGTKTYKREPAWIKEIDTIISELKK